MTSGADRGTDRGAAGETAPPPWSVCLVTDVYPPGCGGSGWSTHALARTLLTRGHAVSVVVVAPGTDGETHRELDDVVITEVGVASARRPWRRLGARDYAHARLERYLRRRWQGAGRVDVVHAQHLHSGPPAVVAGRARGSGTVVTVRDYWPVCVHGTSWWGGRICAGCTPADLTGCLSEAFRWPRPVATAMRPWARRRLRSRAGDLSRADRVITVSDAVARRIAPDVDPARIRTLPNVVDPIHVAARAATAESPGRTGPYLLAAGKLQATKGFAALLDALAVARPSQPVLIAGEGPERATLARRARELALDVEWLGWVDHDPLLRLQRDATAVLLPAAWDEPLSRVVLETLALGTPVVAWPRGGNVEIIDSGRTGWLVESGAELAGVLAALDTPGRGEAVGQAGRALVETRYTPDAVYPQLIRCYTAAVDAARARA